MKHKNRLLSALLSAVLALTLLPAAAFAQETIAGGSPAETQGAAPAAQSADGAAVQTSRITRNTPLDLTAISESNPFGATKDGNVYTNAAEGWSWDTESKTLTLDGATFEVNVEGNESNEDGITAIRLPADATITTKSGTRNVVVNRSKISMPPLGNYAGGGIIGEGNLTINGSGDLSVTGGCFGIVTTAGNLTINAPVSVKCTETDGHVYAVAVYGGDGETPAAGGTIKIGDSLRITTPANGKVGSDKELPVSEYVAESDGKKPAVEVVIEKVSSSHYYYKTPGTTDTAPGKSPKTADAGIALYAGMAAASLLGSGVVLNRKRKRF